MHSLHRLILALALMPSLACDDKEQEEAPCDAAHFKQSRSCGGEALEFCGVDGSSYAWSQCIEAPACNPEDYEADDCMQCELDAEGVPFISDGCGGDTPLVLSFDGAAIEYGSGGRSFELAGCEATDWPTARTPWLALDRDRSGATSTAGTSCSARRAACAAGAWRTTASRRWPSSTRTATGRITAADPAFADLVLWADGDADRRSSGLELQSLATLGLESIELGYASERRCDARANCEVERASFTWRDGLGRAQVGEVVDVHLACQ
jgi:hypothetical protein